MVFGHGFNSRRLHQIWKRTPRVSFFIFYEPRIEPARANQNTKKRAKTLKSTLPPQKHHKARVRGQNTDLPLSRGKPCMARQIPVGSIKNKRRMYHILRLFFIQVADLAYHHASACIFLRLDDIQGLRLDLSAKMWYNKVNQ